MLKHQTVIKSSGLFSIIGLESHCYYSNVSVDFNAPFNLNKASNSIVPTFYRQGTYFNPAFILPREKEYYQENFIFEKTYFEERLIRVNALSEQKESQKTKKQSFSSIQPTVKYCQICKTNFESYNDHIKEECHVTKSEASQANQYMNDLCQRHNKRNINCNGKGKMKLIRKDKIGKHQNPQRMNKTNSLKSLNQKTNNSINGSNTANLFFK